MMIGNFVAAEHGYAGRIYTLLLDAELSIVPAQPSSTEKAPDWRILKGDSASGVEIGAGWNHTGKRAGDYIALQIDDPALPRPLRANLIHIAQGDSFQLLWSRPARAKK